jgi:predicted Zn-dependent protease
MQSRMGIDVTETKARPQTMAHALMQARARALMSKRAEEIQDLVLAYENETNTRITQAQQAGLMYAAVMAYTEQRQADKALLALNRLLALSAHDEQGLSATRWLAADTQRRLGRHAECLKFLNDVSVSRARLLLQVQCRVASQKPALIEQAADQLQLWLADHPKDPLAWDLTAYAYAQSGQALRALRAEAEAKAVRLDEVAAIDRLRAAQSLARELTQQGKLDLGGQQEASIIDARLRALEAKRRELLQPNK